MKPDLKGFKKILQVENFVLVDFYADWCEPCKTLEEILIEVKEVLGDRFCILKIDIDRSQEISTSFDVMSVPVLIFFKNGKPAWRMNGFLSADELIKKIKELIES